ncbi:hypothetical protein FKK34_06215 [Klebsiella quasipneumoniae]|nr:hypothetical protein [Klebsiella quasipneumoniae]MBK3025284.1 hypothetical protein [Klebsiella quasipneumoniae]
MSGERFRVHILPDSKATPRLTCPSAIADIDICGRQGLYAGTAISLNLSQPFVLKLPSRLSFVISHSQSQ